MEVQPPNQRPARELINFGYQGLRYPLEHPLPFAAGHS